jgi:hypothetical protein
MLAEPLDETVPVSAGLDFAQLFQRSVEEAEGEQDVLVVDVAADVDAFPSRVDFLGKALDDAFEGGVEVVCGAGVEATRGERCRSIEALLSFAV